MEALFARHFGNLETKAFGKFVSRNFGPVSVSVPSSYCCSDRPLGNILKLECSKDVADDFEVQVLTFE